MKYWIIQDLEYLTYHIINSNNQFSSNSWRLTLADLFPFTWSENIGDPTYSAPITLEEALSPDTGFGDFYTLVLETDQPPTFELIQTNYPELLL